MARGIVTSYELDEHGECDRCGEMELLAVTRDGNYCLECISADDFDDVADDLTPD